MPTSSTALGADRLDPPALAVVDLGTVVVDAGDDLVADREAGLPHLDLDGSPSRPSALITSRASAFSLADLGVSLRHHQRVLALGERAPPVGDHLLAPGLRVGAHHHPLGRAVDLDRLGAAALADPAGALAVEIVIRGASPRRARPARCGRRSRRRGRRPRSRRAAPGRRPAPAWRRRRGRGRSVEPRVAESTIPASSTISTEPGASTWRPAAAPRSSSPSRRATLVASRPSERRTLAARQVGAATLHPDPGLGPRLGGGDRGEGLAGARLADHDDELLAATGQPLDHRPLVGLDGRAGGEDAGERDLRRPRRGRATPPSTGRRPAPRARSPRSARSCNAEPLAVSPTATTWSRARKRSASSSTSPAECAGTQLVGDRLDHVAAVEVRGVGGQRLGDHLVATRPDLLPAIMVRRIAARSRPIASACERQRSRRLSSVRSRSFARRVSRAAT